MQNAGQYGQGGAPSHQGATYGHTESTASGGSITSSLRQFRKKDVEKQQVNDSGAVAESHVARVAPHNHYPPRPQDCYRYPTQFQDYSLPPQVKYSEISEHQPLQDHQTSPTVIQKAKGKEYMEMCNVAQQHMKQSYGEHVTNQQPYGVPDANLHAHAQYLQKEAQVHPSYKPESQYYPKEAQYQQLPHQMQKYNVPPQVRKFPTENDFLSKLRRIHPTMARSIMSDHHLQESQASYQTMDQSRMYPHQNQRYVNYPSSLQANPYGHAYMPPPPPPQPYSNYPPSCSYTRTPPQMPRFPSTNPHERSISPRRSYPDNLPMSPMNYPSMPQRISPSYPQYNPPEYSQHYQHRRGPVAPQEYYPQPCRNAQYLPHQMAQQEMTENRVTVSDSIKQYIENWADEETASEMNQIETNRLCKENLRVRDEQSTETVYMINASELQYLENGIPLVAENGIPLVTSENGQYFLKSGVTIDNSTGMVRIVDKANQAESTNGAMERVVNLHIMDPLKPDCMLAGKPNEGNQRQTDTTTTVSEKARVVIHQNTVIQPSQNVPKEAQLSLDYQAKVGTSLPVLTEGGDSPLQKLPENTFKKETVDKNCSPINMEQMDEFSDNTSGICPLKLLEQTEENVSDEDSENNGDPKLKNMPFIDLPELPECLQDASEENKVEDESLDAGSKDCAEEAKESPCDVFEEGEDGEEKHHEFVGAVTDNNSSNNVNKINNEDLSTCTQIKADAGEEIEETEAGEKSKEAILDAIKEETKEEMTAESTKEINIEEQSFAVVKREDTSENLGSKNIIEELSIQNPINSTTSEANKEKDISRKECNAVEESQSVIVPSQTNTKKTCEEKEDVTTTQPKVPEEKLVNSVPEFTFSDDKVDKCTIKRTKRIFSVDDIINNIGNNSNKPKANNLLAERRRSLQITREFLEMETSASYLFLRKSIQSKDVRTDTNEEEASTKMEVNDVSVETVDEKETSSEEDKQMIEKDKPNDSVTSEKPEDVSDPENITLEVTESDPPTETEKDKGVQENVAVELDPLCQQPTEENKTNVNEITNPTNEEQTNLEPKEHHDQVEEQKELNVVSPEDTLKCEESNIPKENEVGKDEVDEKVCSPEAIAGNASNASDEEHVTIDKTNSYENVNTEDTTEETPPNLNVKENTMDSMLQNEVQYRNAIRVDENNVLLEIAGELVEISVNLINGKKVITVVPLSESTIVDFNDNYETLDTTQAHDPLKATTFESEENLEVSQVLSVEEVTPVSDVIESTSEIIIGMDISLEEEIQLDLEKPLSVCTKAAKKLYENDLQIPSITTSEDIADNTVSKSYSPNDKVSSSKEQRPEKFKSEKKKISTPKRNLNKKSKHSEPNKSITKELMKIRKVKEAIVHKSKAEEDEEFVPFKDLIKARKLKKMKLLQVRSEENVGADSTNKLEQEDSETELEPKQSLKQNNEEVPEYNNITEKCNDDVENSLIDMIVDKEDASKTKDNQKEPETYPSVEEKEKNTSSESQSVDEHSNTTNNTNEKKVIMEKSVVKKVTFGSISYDEPKKITEKIDLPVNSRKLEDPRLKYKPTGGIIVPSVSELLRENEGLTSNKKKLSLAEYNNRKRKLAITNEQEDKEREAKVRKKSIASDSSTECCNLKLKKPKEEPSSRLKMQRPKSLDDIKIFGKPKDPALVKRKFSLEVTTSKPNHFDWEETQSPKTNLNSSEDSQKRLNEFRGLINNNKSKIVVDVSDLTKPSISEPSEDEILQNYKDQVDSKLSTLNLKIPRLPKPPNPFSSTETITLMQRFLKNEKLNPEEMEMIRRIISYKRLIQQLDKIKSVPVVNSPTGLHPSSYEIRRTSSEKEMKLHLKKVPEKKKKRFRNLYAESTSESDSDFGNGDYAVVQSNSYASMGVPKLIIKRKTEMPVPVVRLERLDLKVLFNGKRKIC